MRRQYVLLLSLVHLWLTTSARLDQPAGNIRVPEVDVCIAQIRKLGNTPPTGGLDGIVGNAYDALQSIDTMPVLPVRYTKCKTTPDGRYLIPDNVDAIPVLASNMDIMASYHKNFTTWYKSTTKGIDKELNAGWTHNFTGSILSASIHGSYSKRHQETKQAFYSQKSSMLHTKLKHHAYTLVADITGGLHPGLERRLMDVAASLENDLLLRARYQMEMIVRDYGTHVAYKADVGAIVEKEDFIDSKSVTTETSQLDSLRKEASASFAYIFKLDAKVTSTSVVNETRREAYEESLTHVQIRNSGGPSVNRLMAGGNDSLLVDNLVGLDEEGLMLFSLINSYNLPHLERTAVDRLALLLLNATQRYYDENAVRGCMDSEAENFNFHANIEDGSCQPDFNNYTFGGMYQACSNVNHPDNPLHASDHCAPYYQKNGITGDFTCPPDYEPVLITSEVHTLADETLEGPTKKHCKHFAWFKYHCKKEKTYYTIKVQVRLENYWCRLKRNATAPEGSGAMFGGLFRSGETNPFTGRAGCPGQYKPYKLALDTTVCLSRDYQLDHEYKVDFAGFFSCQSSQAEKKCDVGYSQHWVTSAERTSHLSVPILRFRCENMTDRRENRHRCATCGKSHSCPRHLEVHVRTHTGERPHKCDDCGKAFARLTNLTAHKRAHSGEKPYECEICGKAFTQSADLTKHRRIHTGEKPYECVECGKAFTQLSHLIRHKRIHSGEKPYECDEYGKAFAQSDDFTKHRRVHTGEKPFKCDDCGKAFARLRDLTAHKRTHSGGKPYECEVCGKAFAKLSNLTVHKRIHTGKKPHKCDDCGKAFTHLAGLTAHRRTHTGEKPFKCDDCGKAFTQLSHLIRHKRSHNAEKPYECDECGKADGLTKHRRVHAGERPFICDGCDKAFTQLSSLTVHKRIRTREKPYKFEQREKRSRATTELTAHKRHHTGERPYERQSCGEKFLKSRRLKAHERTHTGENPYPCDYDGARFSQPSAPQRHQRRARAATVDILFASFLYLLNFS